MKLGLGEIILIVIVIGMIFGVGKIPEIGKQIGKGVRDFKKYSSGADSEKAAGPAINPVITSAAAKTTPLTSKDYPHEPFSKN
jgi:sec-independent protein translocase protein TatA